MIEETNWITIVTNHAIILALHQLAIISREIILSSARDYNAHCLLRMLHVSCSKHRSFRKNQVLYRLYCVHL